MQRSSIDVVVLGASGSGKSCLVQCFVNDAACAPHAPPPSIVPPRSKTILWQGSPSPLTVRVLDTGAATPLDVLNSACASADVFVICFDLGVSGSSDVAASLMESTRSRYPKAVIMMAGTKRDTVSAGACLELSAITDRMRCLGVEGLMLCQSVGAQRHVTTLFLNAIKFAFYPVRPLLDPLSSTLNPALSRVLSRIFALADSDGDGRLSDAELCAYQRRTYCSSLMPQETVGLMEMLLDSGSSCADARGVTADGFLYLHTLMIQGGRQESVWHTLSSHGYAPAPSLLLLPSAIPLLTNVPLFHLLCNCTNAVTWGVHHTTWRASGSHRTALTPSAVRFIHTFLAAQDQLQTEQCDVGSDQNMVIPPAFCDLLEAAAASPSFPDNQFVLAPEDRCSKASAVAAWSAAAAFNPQAVVAALCQAGMACTDASDALHVLPSSCSSERGFSTSSSSPIVVAMLLYGGNDATEIGGGNSSSSVDGSMLKSLKAAGPAILLPRNTKTTFPFTIRCIPSRPPVCIAHVHVDDAVAVAARVLPDLVIALPCCDEAHSAKWPAPLRDHLLRCLPTVPVVSTLDPPAEAAALCSSLLNYNGVDWLHFADAAVSCATSTWTIPASSYRHSSRRLWAIALTAAAAIAAGAFLWSRSGSQSSSGSSASAVNLPGGTPAAGERGAKALGRW